MKRIVSHMVWPDTHVPFEDKRAVRLAMKVAKTVDKIVIGGDFADFYSVSSHSKDPKRSLSLEDEVNATNEYLDKIEALGKEVVYIEGNHENRLTRYLADNAKALYASLSAPKLFRIRERGWKWVPYYSSHKIGRLYVTHDVGHAGSRAHTQSRQSVEGNIAIVHTHRLAAEWVGNQKGSSHVGAMLGWLGDKSAIDYMHKAKTAQWQLGFGVAYEDTKTRNVHIQPVPIIDYTCVVGGALYEAK